MFEECFLEMSSMHFNPKVIIFCRVEIIPRNYRVLFGPERYSVIGNHFLFMRKI